VNSKNKIRKLRKKIKKLKAELVDAHAFAYNMIPDRSDDMEITLDEQLEVVYQWVNSHSKKENSK
jgi:hypothetical protein